MKMSFLLYCLSFSLLVFAHDGHQEGISTPESHHHKVSAATQIGRPTTWVKWIGSFHLILLHFPIALINMLAVSELFLTWYKKPSFEYSSQFLIISAAIFSAPTALLGLIYSYSAAYEGLMETFLWGHMWFGISTAIFAVMIVFVRKYFGKSNLYFSCLVILVLMVNITGFFGGGMTFGPYQMLPPS